MKNYTGIVLFARLASLALAVAATAGCGGADTAQETAPVVLRPTKAAFIAKADAICQRADDEEAPLIYEAAKDLGATGPKLLVVLEKKHRTLSALVPPAVDEEQWSRMLAAISANIDRYRRNVVSSQEGRSTIEDTSQAIGELTDSMRAYGFVWCP
ncbi:MAG: hypothetical protein ABIR67_15025 [Gaiellaceae bacterium]